MGGFFGGIGGQISDMMWRGPQIDTHDLKYPPFGEAIGGPAIELPGVEMPSPPGYQQPPGGQPPSQQQQGYQQYYQQMRQGIDGLSQSLKELESMSTPGGQYKNDNAFDTKMFVPTNSGSVGK